MTDIDPEDLTEDLSQIHNPLDPPPLDELHDLFDLPEELQGVEQYVRWHSEISTRLRREASGLPMKTIQLMLMERIVNFYVVMRSMETDPNVSANQQKNALEFWLKMTTEFNRLLEKHQDKLLNEVVLKVQAILREVLPLISNKEERQTVRRELNARFAEIEL